MNSVSITEPAANTRAKLNVDELRRRYPLAFPNPVKPLRVGIYQVLAKELGGTYSRKQISAALHYYTTTYEYQRALAEGERRIGFDGEPAGDVTSEERRSAQIRLEQRATDNRQRRRDEIEHKTLLHRFQRGQITEADIAAHLNVSPEDAAAFIQKEIKKQMRRREMRLKLVDRFISSGLSLDEFTKGSPIERGQLMLAIRKVGLPGPDGTRTFPKMEQSSVQPEDVSQSSVNE